MFRLLPMPENRKPSLNRTLGVKIKWSHAHKNFYCRFSFLSFFSSKIYKFNPAIFIWESSGGRGMEAKKTGMKRKTRKKELFELLF